MAVADDHAPALASRVDRVLAQDAVERRRSHRNAALVVVAAGGELRHVGVGHAMQAEELARVGRSVRRTLLEDRVRSHEFAVGHRDAAAEALGDPRGVAEMVGMAMGRDDARDRLSGERLREVALPQRARVGAAVARVDQRPAVVFLEQPQVDVVERERQRHPQPQDPGATAQRGPGAGGAAIG
jgi:hypothetical protein